MDFLLTGGAGYIGSHTAVVLAQSGFRVVLYDNLSNSSHAVVERIRQITGQQITFVEGDVRDTDLLKSVLASYGVRAVVHFAGLKAVGESVEKPVDYYANNVQGTISLLQAMRSLQIRMLVFSSSATVYGQPRYLPLDEEHSTSSTNPYGRSKLHVEEILRDVADSDPDFAVACLRYFNPVGAHPSGLIGESPRGVPNNLMPYIAQVAAGQRSELSVFGGDYSTPDGTGIRDYIHVMDLAEGHAAALNFLSKTTGWHALNLGAGKGYSVLNMIHAFQKVSCCEIPYKIVGRRSGDVAACYSNPSKAEKLLGWKASRDLEDMCASMWRFQQSAESRDS